MSNKLSLNLKQWKNDENKAFTLYSYNTLYWNKESFNKDGGIFIDVLFLRSQDYPYLEVAWGKNWLIQVNAD